MLNDIHWTRTAATAAARLRRIHPLAAAETSDSCARTPVPAQVVDWLQARAVVLRRSGAGPGHRGVRREGLPAERHGAGERVTRGGCHA
jgi:hypothetical protein